jgi:hypothetical protein
VITNDHSGKIEIDNTEGLEIHSAETELSTSVPQPMVYENATTTTTTTEDVQLYQGQEQQQHQEEFMHDSDLQDSPQATHIPTANKIRDIAGHLKNLQCSKVRYTQNVKDLKVINHILEEKIKQKEDLATYIKSLENKMHELRTIEFQYNNEVKSYLTKKNITESRLGKMKEEINQERQNIFSKSENDEDVKTIIEIIEVDAIDNDEHFSAPSTPTTTNTTNTTNINHKFLFKSDPTILINSSTRSFLAGSSLNSIVTSPLPPPQISSPQPSIRSAPPSPSPIQTPFSSSPDLNGSNRGGSLSSSVSSRNSSTTSSPLTLASSTSSSTNYHLAAHSTVLLDQRSPISVISDPPPTSPPPPYSFSQPTIFHSVTMTPQIQSSSLSSNTIPIRFNQNSLVSTSSATTSFLGASSIPTTAISVRDNSPNIQQLRDSIIQNSLRKTSARKSSVGLSQSGLDQMGSVGESSSSSSQALSLSNIHQRNNNEQTSLLGKRSKHNMAQLNQTSTTEIPSALDPFHIKNVLKIDMTDVENNVFFPNKVVFASLENLIQNGADPSRVWNENPGLMDLPCYSGFGNQLVEKKQSSLVVCFPIFENLSYVNLVPTHYSTLWQEHSITKPILISWKAFSLIFATYDWEKLEEIFNIWKSVYLQSQPPLHHQNHHSTTSNLDLSTWNDVDNLRKSIALYQDGNGKFFYGYNQEHILSCLFSPSSSSSSPFSSLSSPSSSLAVFYSEMKRLLKINLPIPMDFRAENIEAVSNGSSMDTLLQFPHFIIPPEEYLLMTMSNEELAANPHLHTLDNYVNFVLPSLSAQNIPVYRLIEPRKILSEEEVNNAINTVQAYLREQQQHQQSDLNNTDPQWQMEMYLNQIGLTGIRVTQTEYNKKQALYVFQTYFMFYKFYNLVNEIALKHVIESLQLTTDQMKTLFEEYHVKLQNIPASNSSLHSHHTDEYGSDTIQERVNSQFLQLNSLLDNLNTQIDANNYIISQVKTTWCELLATPMLILQKEAFIVGLNSNNDFSREKDKICELQFDSTSLQLLYIYCRKVAAKHRFLRADSEFIDSSLMDGTFFSTSPMSSFQSSSSSSVVDPIIINQEMEFFQSFYGDEEQMTRWIAKCDETILHLLLTKSTGQEQLEKQVLDTIFDHPLVVSLVKMILSVEHGTINLSNQRDTLSNSRLYLLNMQTSPIFTLMVKPYMKIAYPKRKIWYAINGFKEYGKFSKVGDDASNYATFNRFYLKKIHPILMNIFVDHLTLKLPPLIQTSSTPMATTMTPATTTTATTTTSLLPSSHDVQVLTNGQEKRTYFALNNFVTKLFVNIKDISIDKFFKRTLTENTNQVMESVFKEKTISDYDQHLSLVSFCLYYNDKHLSTYSKYLQEENTSWSEEEINTKKSEILNIIINWNKSSDPAALVKYFTKLVRGRGRPKKIVDKTVSTDDFDAGDNMNDDRDEEEEEEAIDTTLGSVSGILPLTKQQYQRLVDEMIRGAEIPKERELFKIMLDQHLALMIPNFSTSGGGSSDALPSSSSSSSSWSSTHPQSQQTTIRSFKSFINSKLESCKKFRRSLTADICVANHLQHPYHLMRMPRTAIQKNPNVVRMPATVPPYPFLCSTLRRAVKNELGKNLEKLCGNPSFAKELYHSSQTTSGQTTSTLSTTTSSTRMSGKQQLSDDSIAQLKVYTSDLLNTSIEDTLIPVEGWDPEVISRIEKTKNSVELDPITGAFVNKIIFDSPKLTLEDITINPVTKKPIGCSDCGEAFRFSTSRNLGKEGKDTTTTTTTNPSTQTKTGKKEKGNNAKTRNNTPCAAYIPCSCRVIRRCVSCCISSWMYAISQWKQKREDRLSFLQEMEQDPNKLTELLNIPFKCPYCKEDCYIDTLYVVSFDDLCSWITGIPGEYDTISSKSLSTKHSTPIRKSSTNHNIARNKNNSNSTTTGVKKKPGRPKKSQQQQAPTPSGLIPLTAPTQQKSSLQSNVNNPKKRKREAKKMNSSMVVNEEGELVSAPSHLNEIEERPNPPKRSRPNSPSTVSNPPSLQQQSEVRRVRTASGLLTTIRNPLSSSTPTTITSSRPSIQTQQRVHHLSSSQPVKTKAIHTTTSPPLDPNNFLFSTDEDDGELPIFASIEPEESTPSTANSLQPQRHPTYLEENQEPPMFNNNSSLLDGDDGNSLSAFYFSQM